MPETEDRDAPETYYRRARESLDNGLADGLITQRDYDRITEFLDAYDRDTVTVPKPEKDNYRKKRTLATWSNRLRAAAKRIDGSLVDADADTVNQLWQDCLDGDHPDVKDEGLARNTISGQQSTVRMFYEYHDDLGVDKEDLSVVGDVKNTVNEDEIFTLEEIHEMRDAIDHPRNRCLFDLFVYTGQRLRAVQTLRVGDIDLDEGTFSLNEDAGGLKYAEGKRPLLMAEASAREWLHTGHPAPEDEDAYLLCQRQSYREDGEHRPLTQRTIRRILGEIAEDAGVDKPSNPHNFRHAFVTIAKREYDLDNMTIKGLIGHKQKSRVMEETYAHLTDEDHIKAAQRATDTGGLADEDETPTPETCPACKNPLRDGAVACDMCGLQIAPSAHNAKQLARDAVHETAKEATTDQQRAEVDEIRRLVEDNPELIAQALDTEALSEALEDT